MNLIIKSRPGAEQHTSTVKTYAIRIHGKKVGGWHELVHPDCVVDTYEFDDIDDEEYYSGIPDVTLFDVDKGILVIRNFIAHRGDCLDLLVHCEEGKSRSPAIGLALNDIFDLGQDSLALTKKYVTLNDYIYGVMICAAQGLLLLDEAKLKHMREVKSQYDFWTKFHF